MLRRSALASHGPRLPIAAESATFSLRARRSLACEYVMGLELVALVAFTSRSLAFMAKYSGVLQ